MSTEKIPALPAVVTIDDSDVSETVNGGTSKKVSQLQARTYYHSFLGDMADQDADSVTITGGTAELSELKYVLIRNVVTLPYTPNLGDLSAVIVFSASGSLPLNTILSSYAEGYFTEIRNNSAGIITIVPGGSDTINNASEYIIAAEGSVKILSDGVSNWEVLTGTGNPPAGINNQTTNYTVTEADHTKLIIFTGSAPTISVTFASGLPVGFIVGFYSNVSTLNFTFTPYTINSGGSLTAVANRLVTATLATASQFAIGMTPLDFDTTVLALIASRTGVPGGSASLDGGGHVPLGQLAITTTNVAEGTQLYFTQARSRTSIQSVSAALTYDNSAGNISIAQDIRTTGSPIFAALTINGNIGVTGTVDGRDISVDGATLTAHVANISNPHLTTKAQVGLGSVDNLQQVPLASVGAASGVASLTASTKVPGAQINIDAQNIIINGSDQLTTSQDLRTSATPEFNGLFLNATSATPGIVHISNPTYGTATVGASFSGALPLSVFTFPWQSFTPTFTGQITQITWTSEATTGSGLFAVYEGEGFGGRLLSLQTWTITSTNNAITLPLPLFVNSNTKYTWRFYGTSVTVRYTTGPSPVYAGGRNNVDANSSYNFSVQIAPVNSGTTGALIWQIDNNSATLSVPQFNFTTTGGLYTPHLTTTQRTAIPTANLYPGIRILNTTKGFFEVYTSGFGWIPDSPTMLWGGDSNTAVTGVVSLSYCVGAANNGQWFSLQDIAVVGMAITSGTQQTGGTMQARMLVNLVAQNAAGQTVTMTSSNPNGITQYLATPVNINAGDRYTIQLNNTGITPSGLDVNVGIYIVPRIG